MLELKFWISSLNYCIRSGHFFISWKSIRTVAVATKQVHYPTYQQIIIVSREVTLRPKRTIATDRRRIHRRKYPLMLTIFRKSSSSSWTNTESFLSRWWNYALHILTISICENAGTERQSPEIILPLFWRDCNKVRGKIPVRLTPTRRSKKWFLVIWEMYRCN